MSKELIQAARDNNEELKKILSGKNVNIDYVDELPDRDGDNQMMTPLGMAVDAENWEGVRILLAHGASLYLDLNKEVYVSNDTYRNPYIICLLKYYIPVDILKKVIRNTPKLNPLYRIFEKKFLISLLVDDFKDTLKTSLSYEKQRIKIAFLIIEAVIRYDRIVLDYILQNHPDIAILDNDILIEYLKDNSLNQQQYNLAVQGIEYIINSCGFPVTLIPYYQLILKRNTETCLVWRSFPEEARLRLGPPIKQPLTHLFCELQALLFPEENLPTLPIDSDEAKRFSSQIRYSESTLAQIRGRQNVRNLRLWLDETNQNYMLLQLENHTSPTSERENRAVKLLAEIVQLHANTTITTNGKDEKYLSDVQVANAICLINRFYTMSEQTALNLLMWRTLNARMHSIEEKLDQLLTKNPAFHPNRLFSLPNNEAQAEIKSPRP